MPTDKKPTTTSASFTPAEIAAAKAAASTHRPEKIDWSKGIVTHGGGVAATVATLRRRRGPNKKPTKEQVAIRLDRDVVGAFRAGGPGWQTRLNAALKEWLATRSGKRKPRAI